MTQSGEHKQNNDQGRANRRLALICCGAVVGMVGLAYASVPLYDLFCRVTGYGGTTQISDGTDHQVLNREMKIRFDANVNRELAWKFSPVQNTVRLKVGETGLAFYQATNQGAEPIIGTATFNVTPMKAGIYFNKIDCFCFTEQRLEPGQTVDMPVSFYVDPEIDQDENLDDVTEITLSYTFFKAEEQSEPKETAALDLVQPKLTVN